jgi:hypothetical protein
MSSIPQGTPVLWTNLPCEIEPPARYEGCTIVNNALDAARGRWPNLVLVNWAARANSHPEYLMGGGNVHLTPEGASAWTALVTAVLDLRLPAP